MSIWKWFGWDTKAARTERVKDSNKHSTIQWVAFMLALVVCSYIIWG